jgi:hypothetical protein
LTIEDYWWVGRVRLDRYHLAAAGSGSSGSSGSFGSGLHHHSCSWPGLIIACSLNGDFACETGERGLTKRWAYYTFIKKLILIPKRKF